MASPTTPKPLSPHCNRIESYLTVLPKGARQCLCASRHLRDQLDSHHLEEHPALWRVDRPAYAAFSPSFRQFSGRVEANTHDRYGRRLQHAG